MTTPARGQQAVRDLPRTGDPAAPLANRVRTETQKDAVSDHAGGRGSAPNRRSVPPTEGGTVPECSVRVSRETRAGPAHRCRTVPNLPACCPPVTKATTT